MTNDEAIRELTAMLIDAKARAAGYRVIEHGYKAQMADVDVETLRHAIRAIEQLSAKAA